MTLFYFVSQEKGQVGSAKLDKLMMLSIPSIPFVNINPCAYFILLSNNSNQYSLKISEWKLKLRKIARHVPLLFCASGKGDKLAKLRLMIGQVRWCYQYLQYLRNINPCVHLILQTNNSSQYSLVCCKHCKGSKGCLDSGRQTIWLFSTVSFQLFTMFTMQGQ